MSLRLEKFLVLFVTLILCGLILAWSFFLNFGKIEINSNQPFEIHGLAKQPILCQSTYCLEKVPIGVFNATFKSDQFKDINTILEIRRWQTTEAILTFEYEPVLIVSEKPQVETKLPETPSELGEETLLVWDKYLQNAVYFNKQGTKTELMLWNNPAKENLKITNFYNFEDAAIYWGKTGTKILVRNNTDYYLVDLTTKLKYKILLSTDPEEFKFSPDDLQLMYSKDGILNIYNLQTKENYPLDLELDLLNVTWKNNDNLFYFQNTDSNTLFFKYNLETQASSLVFTSELLNPVNLEISSDGNELAFESDNKKYELRLVE